jgi:hypothetical protein
MNALIKRLAVASSLAALVALTAGSGVASAAKIPGCTVAQNIEGIIDDSGSMSSNDPNNNRADLLESLAFFNKDKTMGAVTFGTNASPLFGPFPVGPNFTTIKNALATIDSNSGGTDYDDAFAAANAHNPNANTRIFLSDGNPGGTPDSNLWKNPKIPAYVVGFGTADFAILNQIASETGGPPPFSIENSSQLRTVAQIINARINCEPPPILREVRFGGGAAAAGGATTAAKAKGLGFKPVGKSSQILISWPTVGNVFKAIKFTQGKGKVKVKSARGETFIALTLKKLKKGEKVRFKITPKKLLGPETVTAAIIR